MRLVCITGDTYAVYERVWRFKDGRQHAGCRRIAIYLPTGDNLPGAADVEEIRLAPVPALVPQAEPA